MHTASEPALPASCPGGAGRAASQVWVGAPPRLRAATSSEMLVIKNPRWGYRSNSNLCPVNTLLKLYTRGRSYMCKLILRDNHNTTCSVLPGSRGYILAIRNRMMKTIMITVRISQIRGLPGSSWILTTHLRRRCRCRCCCKCLVSGLFKLLDKLLGETSAS